MRKMIFTEELWITWNAPADVRYSGYLAENRSDETDMVSSLRLSNFNQFNQQLIINRPIPAIDFIM